MRNDLCHLVFWFPSWTHPLYLLPKFIVNFLLFSLYANLQQSNRKPVNSELRQTEAGEGDGDGDAVVPESRINKLYL